MHDVGQALALECEQNDVSMESMAGCCLNAAYASAQTSNYSGIKS